MISQRSAALNKNVLTQIGTLIVLRTTSPQDRRAIEGWLEYHGQSNEVLESLPGLEDGEAWVWSPNWLKVLNRVRFPLRRTFDSGATPSDLRGRRPPATLADIDLGAIRKRMAETIKRAKAEDPRELRRRITELEGQLARAGKTALPPKVERKEIPVLKPGDLRRVEGLAERLTKVTDRLRTVTTAIEGEGRALASAVASAHRVPAPEAVTVQSSPPLLDRPTIRVKAIPDAPGAPKLRAGERRILTTLAAFPSGLARTQLATLSGHSPGSGTFSTYLGILRRSALLDEAADGRFTVTSEGLSAVGLKAAPPPPTREEIIQLWMRPSSRGASGRCSGPWWPPTRPP